jgi:DNA-binding response OmpR family regulator
MTDGPASATPAPGRIVVVDDEPDLRAMLGDYLSLHGFAVRGAADAAALEALVRAEGPPDLLVLDVNMPGEDGFALLRRLRASGCRAGVVMLTAAAVDPPSRVAGLDGGADDYLAKPVELRELLARVRSVLRRLEADKPPAASPAPAARPRRHRFGRCTLDAEGRRLLDAAGAEVPLTAMEYDLLAALARHPDKCSRATGWPSSPTTAPLAPGDRSVDIRVARLRQKLERDPAARPRSEPCAARGYAYEPEG